MLGGINLTTQDFLRAVDNQFCQLCTQYFFGKGRADNASADATYSKWSVPVAANHSGEPGYNSSFASSFTSRPWRWNLDYVVAPNQTTMTYYYGRETNRYKKNLTTETAYERGGLSEQDPVRRTQGR